MRVLKTVMYVLDVISWLTEENLRGMLERYRSLGPFRDCADLYEIICSAAANDTYCGPECCGVRAVARFLYSWIGLVAGCLATFLMIRKIASQRFFRKWAERPKVARAMEWVRRSGFSYVFLLSLFPVGPFVVINVAAGLVGMRLRSYLLALAAGKAVMVFAVSYIGNDVGRFIQHPVEVLYVLLFVLLSLWGVKSIEAYFSRISRSGGDGGSS